MHIYFLGGMPRAGSTLLLNLLGQNPSFYVSPTSGVLELIYAVRNQFSNIIEFKSQDQSEMQSRLCSCLRGLLIGWYLTSEIVIDKSRGWLQYYELLSSFWPYPKIIVPIRDIRDSIASFERLWRSHPFFHHPADNPSQNPDFQFIDGRCKFWLATQSPIGLSLARIYDSIARGHSKHLLFVRYEDLTNNPLTVLTDIYTYLGETPFTNHDPDNIPQITHEDDSFFGPLGDHNIRSKIEPNLNKWQNVLPPHVGQLIVNTFPWFYNTFYPNDKSTITK